MDTVEALFTSGVISMAADACRILSIFVVIAIKNTGLALVLLLVLPLLTLFTRHVQKRMLSAQLANRKAVASISGQVPETIHNIRTIHALGLEDYMERRYDRSIGESYAAVEKTNFYDAIYSPVVLILDAAVVGLVMLLSATGNATVLQLFGMSVGTAVTMIDYISRIFTPIETLGMEIQTIQSAMAGVRRIDAFLAQPERDIPAQRSCPRGDVELSHVTFGYDQRTVLSGLSFTVKAGEQVTLVGRTGAGKSTVFRLLLGLYHPQEGSLTIGGVDVSQIPDQERRKCIGCVEQHFSRVPGTVLEQITLSDPQITREMAETAAKLAGLDAVIRSFPQGYDTPCTDSMFSQGEWQLLSIARAAARRPRRAAAGRDHRQPGCRHGSPGHGSPCAGPRKAGPCSPSPTEFTKASAAGSSRSILSRHKGRISPIFLDNRGKTEYHGRKQTFQCPGPPKKPPGRIENPVRIRSGTATVSAEVPAMAKAGHWSDPRRPSRDFGCTSQETC